MSKSSQNSSGQKGKPSNTTPSVPKQRKSSEDRYSQSSDHEMESKHLIKKGDGTPKGIKGIAISDVNIKILTFLLMFFFASLFVYSFVNFVWAAILGASVTSKPTILKDTVFRRVPFVTLTLNLIEMMVFVFAFITCIKYNQLIGLKKKHISKKQIKKVYKYIKSSRCLIMVMIILLSILWIVGIFEDQVIAKRIEKNIIRAIELYSYDLEVKRELNSIQLTYQCCGSKSYKDWAYESWYDKADRPPVYGSSLGNYKDVPFSCCKKDILTYCVYYDIDKTVIKYQNQPLKLNTLNRKGCAQVLIQEFKSFTTFRDFIILILIITLAILRINETIYYTSKILKGPPVSYLFKQKYKT